MNYRILALSICIFLLVSALRPPSSAAFKVLQPGGTLVIKTASDGDNADGRGESCIRFLLGTCETDPAGDRFGILTTATTPFNRGQGTVSQYYDFEVDNAGDFGTALLTQISGSAKLNGFMAMVGGGQTEASLALKVLDLGPTLVPDVDGGKVIHSETLANHSLQGVAVTGLDFGIKVEGGAPYLGAGAGPEIKFNVNLVKNVVRDNLDFGFSTVLIRGHSYRLQFELSTLAKKGASTGTAISQFKLGGPVIDMLNTQHWLQGLKDTINADLPNMKSETMVLKSDGPTWFQFPDLHIMRGVGWFDNRYLESRNIYISGFKQNYLPDFADTNGFLQARALGAGLPTSFQDLVEKRFNERAVGNAVEEGIERPGVEVLGLRVTMQDDQVAMLKEIINLLHSPPGNRGGFSTLK